MTTIPLDLYQKAEDRTEVAYAAILEENPWFTPEGGLEGELRRIVEMPASLKSKYRHFVRLADRISEAVDKHSQCKRGCSHCCYISVGITETEAELIGEAIKTKPTTPKNSYTLFDEHLIDGEEFKAAYFGKPCGFLDGTDCSIYENRPIACRLHHNLGDAFFCRVDVPIEESMVSTIDTRAITGALMVQMIKKKPGLRLADIREFFPEGLGR